MTAYGRALRTASPFSNVAVWAAGALVTLSCVVLPGGLLSASWTGDVAYYDKIGERIANGLIPYHDFYLEYPPGSLAAFAAPSFLSQAHYVLVFKLLMTLCAVIATTAGIALMRRYGAAPRIQVRAAVALGLAPLALGPVFLNRFDLWPAAVLAVALYLLAAGRSSFAFSLLALAVAAKIYALAVVPIAAIHVLRTHGRGELERALALFVVVGLVIVLPFAALGFGGLGYTFYTQATRQLQLESLGAQLLVAAGHLGVYHPMSVFGAPGSRNLAGPAADDVGYASSLFELLFVSLVSIWYWRGPHDSQRLTLASAAAVTAFVAFGKVLSPQYLVWLVPLIPLIDAGVGLAASLVLGLALTLTQIEFYDSEGVAALSTVSWVVLLRDLLLVVLFAIAVRRLAKAKRIVRFGD